MNLNLNRGISTPLSITIIIVIGILTIGGILAYDLYFYSKDDFPSIVEESKSEFSENETSGVEEKKIDNEMDNHEESFDSIDKESFLDNCGTGSNQNKNEICEVLYYLYKNPVQNSIIGRDSEVQDYSFMEGMYYVDIDVGLFKNNSDLQTFLNTGDQNLVEKMINGGVTQFASSEGADVFVNKLYEAAKIDDDFSVEVLIRGDKKIIKAKHNKLGAEIISEINGFVFIFEKVDPEFEDRIINIIESINLDSLQ